MRPPLSGLNERRFDVLIIGGGINGASAAQHLTAAGYSVLLVEKTDFASGSTSRSSRLLHCGMSYMARVAYLTQGGSLRSILKYPHRVVGALRMSKRAMQCRQEFVTNTPERVRPLKFCFAAYKDGPYAAWQIDLAFRLLTAFAPKGVPLDYRRIPLEEARRTPLVQMLGRFDQLSGIGMFREYQFEWPERICLDTILDAERIGALVRNYTAVTQMRRESSGTWTVALEDMLEPGATATVSCDLVLNTTGMWIDGVNALGPTPVGRKIAGMKGVHIMVRLPPDCADYGIATFDSAKDPIYCIPWRGMHYIGPLEAPFEGSRDEVAATSDEIDQLIVEANRLLPDAGINRDSILFTWAGVRPATYDPALPRGRTERIIHDLGTEGMPGVLAVSSGSIMTHRDTGRTLCASVRTRLPPRGPVSSLSYAASRFPENQNSPPLLDDYASIKLADLRHAAAHEHPVTLADLLFRRTGAGWTRTMAHDAAQRAAETVADLMGWDPTRVTHEVAAYRATLDRLHGIPRGAKAAPRGN